MTYFCLWLVSGPKGNSNSLNSKHPQMSSARTQEDLWQFNKSHYGSGSCGTGSPLSKIFPFILAEGIWLPGCLLAYRNPHGPPASLSTIGTYYHSKFMRSPNNPAILAMFSVSLSYLSPPLSPLSSLSPLFPYLQ